MPILPSLVSHRLKDSNKNVQSWGNSFVNSYMCLTHTASGETREINSAKGNVRYLPYLIQQPSVHISVLAPAGQKLLLVVFTLVVVNCNHCIDTD